MRLVPRRAIVVILFALLLIAGGWASRGYAEGLAFVLRAANVSGRVRWIADHYETTHETERIVTIPARIGSLRARVFWPEPNYAGPCCSSPACIRRASKNRAS